MLADLLDMPTGVHQKTARRRARDAKQQLHNARRPAAPQGEHRFAARRERPAVTEVVAWAASNGDRIENADYQYGKRRPPVDGRIRFLTKQVESAEVVDPETPRTGEAATRGILWSDCALCQCRGNGASGEHRGHRRGRSQPQPHRLGARLWGATLMKSAAGDRVVLQAPGGTQHT